MQLCISLGAWSQSRQNGNTGGPPSFKLACLRTALLCFCINLLLTTMQAGVQECHSSWSISSTFLPGIGWWLFFTPHSYGYIADWCHIVWLQNIIYVWHWFALSISFVGILPSSIGMKGSRQRDWGQGSTGIKVEPRKMADSQFYGFDMHLPLVYM